MRRRIGIVDLGSNSARLVVFECEAGRGYRLLDEIREVVRLGEGLAATGRLSEAAIDRATQALRSFADYARATDLSPPRVMATSAVRSAANREDFLDAIADIDLEVEILDGAAEAEQGVVAVANTSRFRDAWIVDLGGGSAQVSRMTDRRYRGGRAYPLGAIRTTEEFLRSDPPTSDEIAGLEAAVSREMGPTLARMRDDDAPVVAMGGTVRNLARAVQKRRGHPWQLLHAYRLGLDDLEALTDRLAGRRAERRAGIKGISSYRADIILAGAIVFRSLLRQAGREGLVISGFGVREGAFFQAFLDPPHLLQDVREFSVSNLLWQYPQPVDHVARVERLGGEIFEALRPLHGYGEAEAALLRAGARLHDIGKAVGFRDHDHHGAYLIAGAPLPGFDHREQAMLSRMVRYHRGGNPKPAPYSPLFDRADRLRLRRLTVCLRLAEYLERSRTGRVRHVSAGGERGGMVTLRLHCDGQPWVELRETRKQAPVFRTAFDRDLELELVS